jgi:hypothetical protein
VAKKVCEIRIMAIKDKNGEWSWGISGVVGTTDLEGACQAIPPAEIDQTLDSDAKSVLQSQAETAINIALTKL